ncbi:MAG TPA: SprT family zinc-dependent metalloprotease [Burkholderiales bacterium]|nr:SprT family zinc-dependent metalloprotease [Burkholderiales bacterium]
MDRAATEGIGVIELDGRSVEYRFARRRRRTLGLSVDAHGLKVVAPLRAPWREIDAFLREKRRWIVAKLDEWARVPKPPLLHGMSGESLPLFGVAHILEVSLSVPERVRSVIHEPGRLIITAPRWRALETLVRWLKARALEALEPRAAHFAARLGRAAPPVRLSNARTQWGVCGADGSIRLSWRLVHLAPELADYVVAHEVAHLVELNHSRRFWSHVAVLYPQWRGAREQLELAGASLPVMKGKR